MHKIDILLATHNGEKYLEAQLKSLLAQSYSHWDIIIHDDNSTDNTIGIIKGYAKQYPNKITFINDSIFFQNASENFNFLLEHSNADYIMFCDQDDIWLPHKIKVSLERIKTLESEHPSSPAMVFSDLEVVDENLTILAKSMWKQQKLDPNIMNSLDDILALNVVSGCTIMINKLSKDFISPLPKRDISHDHWIAVNIVKYGYAAYTDKALIKYRQHQKNTIGVHSRGFKYLLLKTIGLVKSPSMFFKKYSHFDFSINRKKILFRKLILNIKRLF